MAKIHGIQIFSIDIPQ